MFDMSITNSPFLAALAGRKARLSDIEVVEVAPLEPGVHELTLVTVTAKNAAKTGNLVVGIAFADSEGRQVWLNTTLREDNNITQRLLMDMGASGKTLYELLADLENLKGSKFSVKVVEETYEGRKTLKGSWANAI
jgi:hypothetical protein